MPIIDVVWKILFWMWIVTELYVLLKTRTRRGAGDVTDRGSLIVLWVVIGSSIFVGEWMGAAYRPAILHGMRWLPYVSLTLLAVGLAVRWTAIYTLGKSFSANVAIHATQRLHTTGLFHYLRHPSYTGMVLIFLALGLATRNWMSIAIILIPPVLALLYRIHVEEQALTGAFGEQYVDYSRRTKRLVPGVY